MTFYEEMRFEYRNDVFSAFFCDRTPNGIGKAKKPKHCEKYIFNNVS